jgi:hypothetical protein
MGEKLHESDRLVIAGLLRRFLPMPPEQRAEVCALAAALPQHERTKPARMPTPAASRPGQIVLGLPANRNLSLSVIAKAPTRLADRPYGTHA